MSSSPKVWLITGANAGFGKSMLDCVLAKGDTAIAGVRRPETLKELQDKIGAQRLIIVKLDVTKPEDITSAFKEIKEKVGRIDVLYNNAGFPNVGEVEAVPWETARAVFETNFWGSTAVLRATLEFMREENKPIGGRILQMASMLGSTVDPCTGYYGATKHAVEAISLALSKELQPEWNIKVTVLEPGYFLTTGLKGDGDHGKSYEIMGHPAYTGLASTVRAVFSSMDSSTVGNFIKGDPDKLSLAVYKASELEEPPVFLPLGKDAVEKIKANLTAHLADLDKYASWSDDLTV